MANDQALITTIMAMDAHRINAIDKGKTLFHRLIGKTDITRKDLRKLKKRGVNFNAVDHNGDSIFSYAILFKRSYSCLKSLSELGADHTMVNGKGCTLLYQAALMENLEGAKFLISIAPDMVKAVDNKGDTPLHIVFKGAYRSANALVMAELLLSNGADVNAVSGELATCLEIAVVLSDASKPSVLLKNLDILKKYGANFNCVDTYGRSPLAVAIANHHNVTVLQKLIEFGADWKFVCEKHRESKMSMLHIASGVGHIEAAVLLVSLGADVNEVIVEGRTALSYSVFGDNKFEDKYTMIKFLLENGSQTDMKNLSGNTLLHGICVTGIDEELMIDKEFKLLQLLKDYGMDFNAVNIDQDTPLKYAICGYRKDIKFIEALIEHGADPNLACGDNHWTALHHATYSGDLELVKLLLSKGCDVNALDKYLQTPLHCLFYEGKENAYDITKLLLELGADPNAQNIWEQTVLDCVKVCLNNNQVEQRVIQLLTTAGARYSYNGVDVRNSCVLQAVSALFYYLAIILVTYFSLVKFCLTN